MTKVSDRQLLSETRAIELMTVWVASIADKVRNPVAGISAALQVFERQLRQTKETGHNVANDQQVDAMQQVIQQIHQRLAALDSYVGELVSFAKPIHIQPRLLDLHEMIETIASEEMAVVHHWADAALSLDLEVATVYADPASLPIVLRHLVRNAVEALIKVKNPQIKITSKLKGTSVSIEISDNGPGFDEKRLQQLSQPFASSKDAGTGLGLSISQRYVHAHGGAICLRNGSPSGGASVEVSLPRSLANQTNHLSSGLS